MGVILFAVLFWGAAICGFFLIARAVWRSFGARSPFVAFALITVVILPAYTLGLLFLALTIASPYK